jgi:hypothetical protein
MPLPLDRNRLPWLILAIAMMLASAICGLLYMDAVGKISGWIGLPQYEGYVPRLQWYAGLWSVLAVLFPFLAALLLGFVRDTGPRQSQSDHPTILAETAVSQEWTLATAALKYLLRVAISGFASVTLMVVLILVVFTLEKLGVWAR